MFPGLISMFGGTLHKNENIEEGLARELSEELELEVDTNKLEKLGVFYKTKSVDGVDFEIHVFIIRDIDANSLKLYEGKSVYSEKLENALQNPKLTRITRVALESFQNNSTYNHEYQH